MVVERLTSVLEKLDKDDPYTKKERHVNGDS
jgi:hypothetical protein